MDNATHTAGLAQIAERVGISLVEEHGGFLRCEHCRRKSSLSANAAAAYMSAGWPTCHGHTMHWWTARQVAAGEVPA